MKQKKLSFSERVSLTARAYALLRRYCPGLARGKALYALLDSIRPLGTAWLTAGLIGAGTEFLWGKTVFPVIGYAVLLLAFRFFCTLAKTVSGRVADEKESRMWTWFGKVFSDKQAALSFADAEDPAVRKQRQEAEDNLYLYGNGLAQVVWGTTSLIRAGTELILSIIMAVPLFFTHSAHPWLDSPLWVFVIGLLALLGGIGSMAAVKKEDAVFLDWSRKNVSAHRMLRFWGQELPSDSKRAMDVRLYGQERAAEHAFGALLEKDRDDASAALAMTLPGMLSAGLLGVITGCVWLYTAAKAYSGAFGADGIVRYAAALTGFCAGVREVMYVIADNATCCGHLAQLFAFLELPEERTDGGVPIPVFVEQISVAKEQISVSGERISAPEKQISFPLEKTAGYEIEFRNVSFRYPGAAEYALKNVSFRFRAGETLAVVGRNGSGKTTFIKLLCRLYQPTEGGIFLNGTDIRTFDEREYRALFGVVFQDFSLPALPLGQNVAAAAEYDRERAEDCLVRAGFGERLSGMRDGTETYLSGEFSPDGTALSGGEAQKLALARALYRDAPFLVLDEPTAALDPVSEYELYRNFSRAVGAKGALLISHRLTSCRFCDRIAVFSDGGIVSVGTHDALVSVPGEYRTLWDAQAQYYTNEK